MKKTDIDIRHIFDLANRSYNNNQYTFTSFLTLAQMTDFYDNISQLPPCGYTVSGGYDGAERVMIRFGKEEELGYGEEFPIVCVCIEPLMQKFADELTHRDVLGSIMNLQIERENLGDILIKDNVIWVMCLAQLSDTILNELSRIKHTSVKCSIVEDAPKALAPRFEELRIQATQPRIDNVLSKICKLSRNASATLFLEGKVAVNGRVSSNHSYILKENDIISVRGFGKYRYERIDGTTRKGNQVLVIMKYT